jgi:hypothetical protein
MSIQIKKVKDSVWKITGDQGISFNNLSGDHNAFSFDSSKLILEDGLTGEYNFLNLEDLSVEPTGVFRTFGGSVNEDWAWAPHGSDFCYVYRNRLYYTSEDGGGSVELPKIAQWRVGSASGYDIQFLKGYGQNPARTYFLPFRVNTESKSIELLDGFWLGDISNDGNILARNISRYQDGFLCSLRIDAAFARFFRLDGSDYKIIEPVEPNASFRTHSMSHPTTNLKDLISARPFNGDIDSWLFDAENTTIERKTLISQARLKEITEHSNFPAWQHGCLGDKYCIFSTLENKGTTFGGIYVMDKEAENVHLVCKSFDPIFSGSFIDYPRPSMSQNPDKNGNYWGAWHERGGVVYLARLDAIKEDSPPPPSDLEERIKKLEKGFSDLIYGIAIRDSKIRDLESIAEEQNTRLERVELNSVKFGDSVKLG